MVAPAYDAILIRRVDEHWFVIEGFDSHEYSQDFYREHGRDFELRTDAFTYARILARLLDIDECEILEDLGDED